MGFASDKRWWALIILCLGALMIVLDTTIVNVALPSIRADLGFSQESLVWVINAYMLTFSGFLLLGGRLGDIFGHRRIFLIGLVIFTLASLACGFAHSQAVLIAARAIQGFGGAIVNSVAFSLIITLFHTPEDRAKAMGFFGFVASAGGALGVLLGGVLTGSFDWHYVFLVNIPIGVIVFALCAWLLPHSTLEDAPKHLDAWGAVLVTTALMLAVYGIVGGNDAGWLSFQTLGCLGAALAVLAVFMRVESRVQAPLVPLSVFSIRNVTPVSLIGILWSAAMFTWFFLSALYLQLILNYTPLQIGLAFLPANLIMAAFSIGLSARIVMRFGVKLPLMLGMGMIALGLGLFAVAPLEGGFLLHVLPAMIALGIGCGLAFNPVLLAGTSDVPESEAGLVSGVLNTSFMMGGSLGLAVLASLAAWRTGAAAAAGAPQLLAMLEGYHLAFGVGMVSALLAVAVASRLRVAKAAGASVHAAH